MANQLTPNQIQMQIEHQLLFIVFSMNRRISPFVATKHYVVQYSNILNT
nr:MAG TPA: hypothetical protein [Caudoviricetes sp.]